MLAALVVAGWALQASAEAPSAVALSLEGMSYVLSRGTEVDLLIDAKRAEVSPEAGRITFSGVRARVGRAAGAAGPAGGFELACERGDLDLATGEFVARGRVAGAMQGGRTLRTERLVYRHARGLVSSDAPVTIRDEVGAYRGGGFQYWVRENRFRLTGGASIQQGE
jgi:hypothetical protein